MAQQPILVFAKKECGTFVSVWLQQWSRLADEDRKKLREKLRAVLSIIDNT